MRRVTVDIGGMINPPGDMDAEKKLRDLPGIHAVRIDYVTSSATIEYDENVIDPKSIKTWIRKCGYHCSDAQTPALLCPSPIQPGAGHKPAPGSSGSMFTSIRLPMFRLAVRHLLYESFKSVLIVFAIGAVIATILILRGFENGFYEQARRFVLNRQAAVVVSQSGVLNLLGDRSSLPQQSRQAVEDIPGVDGAYPVTAFPVIYKHGMHQNPVILWVYDQKGGPTHVIRGQMIQDSREVVVDWSLAKKFGLQTGDSFVVSDFEFRIAGITDNSTVMSSPVVFVTYDGLIDMFLESDVIADVSVFPLLSHLLVDIKEGANPGQVMSDIERSAPGTNVRTLQQVAEADVDLSRGVYGPPVGFLISISYLAGILVISLICFSDVSGRLKSFAILKALGFRNSQLIRTVSLQTVLLLLAAFPLGIFMAMLGGRTIEIWWPQFLIAVFVPAAILKTAGAAFILAIAGSLLPVRSIVRADPADAFRGN